MKPWPPMAARVCQLQWAWFGLHAALKHYYITHNITLGQQLFLPPPTLPYTCTPRWVCVTERVISLTWQQLFSLENKRISMLKSNRPILFPLTSAIGGVGTPSYTLDIWLVRPTFMCMAILGPCSHLRFSLCCRSLHICSTTFAFKMTNTLMEPNRTHYMSVESFRCFWCSLCKTLWLTL